MAELRPPDSVEVVQVIQVKSLRGDGTEVNPIRTVVQYWSFDGQLLAEKDSKNGPAL